jgi:hypothetical protein
MAQPSYIFTDLLFITWVLARLDPAAHPDFTALSNKAQTDPRTVMPRVDSEREGGWAGTSQILKERSGALRTVRDGRRVLVTTHSFYAHLVDRLIASHPRGAKPVRARTPLRSTGCAAAMNAAASKRSRGAVSERWKPQELLEEVCGRSGHGDRPGFAKMSRLPSQRTGQHAE